MELLAPAGGKEALLAAIHNGADAVYLGYTLFGARAGAGNFDEQGLLEAIKLCHLYHIRVHVTVNTLIKETEIDDLYRVLKVINDAGADAVILQDLGAAGIVRDCFPGLKRHASTQMAIHNRQGAAFLIKEGFHRVVLARECALSEIQKVAQTGIETEVFIHGAMCVGVSGQCLFSSMAGGRSGNRGRCAQPCRMRYDYDGKKGYWLSPRDLMLRDMLPQLQKAGVCSLKIEGRLKRPEYVAVVTKAYRKALDALNEGRFELAEESELEGLKQIFNRGGFMQGYAGTSQDGGVIFPGRPGHGGIMVGRVTGVKPGFVQVALTKDLNNGDGIQFQGVKEGDVTYSGPAQKAGDTALVRLREGLHPELGGEVIRLADAAQMIEAMMTKISPILVDAILRAEPGEIAKLTVTDGESEAEATGDIVPPAQNRPLSEEAARQAMQKTGDTPFVLQNMQLQGYGGHMTAASMNAHRRQALETLKEKRAVAFGKRESVAFPLTKAVFQDAPAGKAELMVQSPDAALGQRLLDAGADVFLFAPEDYTLPALEKAAGLLPAGTWFVLPVQARADTLDQLRDFTESRKDIFAGVVLSSIGQAGGGFTLPMAAGEGVPVMNSQTAAELVRLKVKWQTISPELNEKEMRKLPIEHVPLVLSVYGRTRLMVLNHCPARTALHLTAGHESCRMCEERSPQSLYGKQFVDSLNHDFPLSRTRLPEGCIINVLNTLPLNLFSQTDKLRNISWQLCFTLESIEEQLSITAAFHDLRRGQASEAALPAGTMGHFKRGVE